MTLANWSANVATYVASSPGPAGPGSHKDTAKRFRFVTNTSWGMSLKPLFFHGRRDEEKPKPLQQSGKMWN